MPVSQILKIRLSLKGRPIRAYVFDQDCILVGRNPQADVYLDNPGISRDHLKIERAPGGFFAEDLNSANGTFVNDVRIKKQYLQNEDVVRIGKFSLWLAIEHDRRGHDGPRTNMSSGTVGGTTVLSTSELEEMMRVAREAEPAPPAEPQPAPRAGAAPARRSRRAQVLVLVGLLFAFALGTVLGAGAMWYVQR
jgi:pSer/pThr/pTyr-binding forkhead associated (FHA) protein